MIAACPKCEARYRVDENKLGPEGARLRCAKCQAVFRVRAPQAGAPAPVAPAPAVTAPVPVPAPAPNPTQGAAASRDVAAGSPSAAPAPGGPADEPHIDRDRCVLVADPDEERGKATASALAGWGLQPLLVHDGVEAMLSIQRAEPKVVVLDAALPKMFGFQICEVMKRNESLSEIKVVLIGAIHAQDRYRRPPTDTYGADVYLEQPDLPDGLAPLLQQFGLSMSTEGKPAVSRHEPDPAPAPAMPQPEAAVAPPPKSVPVPAEEPAGDPELAEEREKAERLSRIIVSDIVLYQAEKFEQAIAGGNLLELLDSEIEEGRKLFRQRIDERVREERDHLVEELTRVARGRGMK